MLLQFVRVFSNAFTRTHAVLHHHEAALVSLETLALEAAGRVDAGAVAAQVRGDAALVDVWKTKSVTVNKKDGLS